jgi:Pyruvate/2-oxoacid:ferredoxin oxidoreductase delta subunit
MMEDEIILKSKSDRECSSTGYGEATILGVESIKISNPVKGGCFEISLDTIRKFLISKCYPTNPIKEPESMPEALRSMSDSKDPWKHRSCGMKCRSCMWYVPKETATLSQKQKENLIESHGIEMFPAKGFTQIGRCRRHAPTMNGYPVVFEDDWCGDHKLDETKV